MGSNGADNAHNNAFGGGKIRALVIPVAQEVMVVHQVTEEIPMDGHGVISLIKMMASTVMVLTILHFMGTIIQSLNLEGIVEIEVITVMERVLRLER